MTLRRVLVELTERRYRVVLDVQAGVPVTEVAVRFGVSRRAVHRWVGWYRKWGTSGWAGLALTCEYDVLVGAGLLADGMHNAMRHGH